MTIFSGLTNEGLENSQDRLGGFNPLETDIYTGTIKALFAGKSKNDATSVTIIADFEGREYRETLYVTNRKGENFYLNKNDKTKKVPLPGFTAVDDICLITTGKPLAEQNTEDKTINLYDFDQKREVPTSVPMLVETLGEQISLGILKQLENKSELQGSDYVPTAETRELNVLDKVFHPEHKLTVAEAREGQDEAKFWESWSKRNKGNTRDKRTIKEGEAGASGRPSRAAGAAPSSGAATKSLFQKKA